MAVLGLRSESLNSQAMTMYLAVNNPARAGTVCVCLGVGVGWGGRGRGSASGSRGITGSSLLAGLNAKLLNRAWESGD